MNPVKFFIIFIISNFISVDLFANLDLEDINASSETAQTQTSSNANNSRKDGNYVAKEMEPSEDNFMKLYIHSSLGKTEGEVFTVRSAEANLRQGPSIDSRRLITVHTGAKFRKIDERDLWVQVLVPKKLVMQIAYCHFDHCKLEGKLVTMTSKAYLYAFPSDISLKLNEFDEGAQFKHLVSYEPWRKVQIGPLPTEIQAYIHTSLLDVVDGVAKIKVAYATVRKGPSTRYKEVYTAKRNDKFIFLSYSGKWAHVAIPDTYANAVRQEIKMGRVIRVVSVLNFRSGPSTSHRIIGSLRNNERFEVLASKDNWYKINYRRQVGWVHKNYVQLLSDSADLPVPESAKSEPSNEPNQPTLPKSDNSGDDAGSRNLDTRETSNNVARSGRQVEIRGVPEFAQRGSDPYSSNGQSWRPHAYCGPTSMQMVLAYHGVKRSRDWIAMTHPTTGRRVQRTLMPEILIVRLLFYIYLLCKARLL